VAHSIEPSESEALTVHYDGECAVCSREIALYRRSRGARAISWVDVQGDAFRELWSPLPAWRWLARVTKPVAVAALHMPIPGSSSGAKGRGQRHGAIQTYRCDCGETCVLTMRVNSGRCGFIAVSSAQSAIRVLDSSAYIISRQSEQIWH
jgi:hypothetical protein